MLPRSHRQRETLLLPVRDQKNESLLDNRRERTVWNLIAA